VSDRQERDDAEITRFAEAIEHGEHSPPVQLALTIFWMTVVGLFVAAVVLAGLKLVA
jgi:hypothetical protein